MSRSKVRQHKPLIISVIGLLIMLFAAKYLFQWIGGKPPQKPPLVVQTVRVKEMSMPVAIETVGSLTALKEVKIKATGPGKVAKILVASGSYVKAGTELAQIVGGAEIRAPFDGYLSDWQVKVGEYVVAGTELVDFVDTDVMSLTYRVPEQYAHSLDLGQDVQMNIRAFPEKTFLGKLRFISPVVDKKTYTILLRAEINNTDQMLWPGMSTHVRHILSVDDKALVVPEAALILTMEGYQLLVVEQGKLVKRSVTLGEREHGRVHIRSGVAANESVLLTQNDLTKEGTQVVGKDWQGEW